MGLFKRRRKAVEFNDYHLFKEGRPLVLYSFGREDFIKKGYSANSSVYKVIQKIVNKCAYPPTYLYETKGNIKSSKAVDPLGSAIRRVEISKSVQFASEKLDLYKLLQSPNEKQTWKEFITLFRLFYFIQGEGFIVRETPLNSEVALNLYVVSPNQMTPTIKDGEIKNWKWRTGVDREITLDIEDVLHLVMPNPNFDYQGSHFRGLSPLAVGIKYLQLSDESVNSWLKSVQNEGAKGILSPNHPNPENWLSPEQVELTEKRVEEKVLGSANKNKIAISGMPLQYTQIGLSPEGMAIIQALDKAGVELADLWGVPATLFEPNPTYQNQQSASIRFVSEVVIPYLEREEEALNLWLVKPFSERDKKEYYLDNDTSVFPELKLSLEQIDSLSKILTINELRVAQGYDTIDSTVANTLLVDSGKIPITDLEDYEL